MVKKCMSNAAMVALLALASMTWQVRAVSMPPHSLGAQEHACCPQANLPKMTVSSPSPSPATPCDERRKCCFQRSPLGVPALAVTTVRTETLIEAVAPASPQRPARQVFDVSRSRAESVRDRSSGPVTLRI